MQFDFDPRIIAREIDNRNAIGLCKAIVELDAILQFFEFERSVFELATDFGAIDARDFRSRMREAIG